MNLETGNCCIGFGKDDGGVKQSASEGLAKHDEFAKIDCEIQPKHWDLGSVYPKCQD